MQFLNIYLIQTENQNIEFQNIQNHQLKSF